MRWRDVECFEGDDRFDPLYLVRSRPVEDEEADLIEAICRAATPGPWVVDDATEGCGTLVATLADGRNVVSVRPPESCLDGAWSAAVANAQLICEARCVVLRLVRDRRRWKRREKRLREKIEQLQEQLERQSESLEQTGVVPEEQTAPRPR
jgi:hypothetical protein